jgi:FtsP/CotA-like multicopper oxidase with cupredoxin domain
VTGRLRALTALAVAAVVVLPLGWFWYDSLVPETYSAMQMGQVDLGGGPEVHTAGHDGHGIDISTHGAPDGLPDVQVALTARAERFRLATGQHVDGFTLNGSSPGPTVRAVEGDLVEVRLTNDDVADRVTLHWHGIDVPNAMDGVAGVTQDAVGPGETFTYRFVAEDAGTYWYHSHQLSHAQVRRGLLGAVVVEPSGGVPEAVDVTALVHTYGGDRTVNGHAGEVRMPADPGSTVRVRVINSDNGPMSVWVSGAEFRVAAVDGTEVNRPTALRDVAVAVTAGGRADLVAVVPPGGFRVELSGAAVAVGDASRLPSERPPRSFVDLLSYGKPAELGFDPQRPDRRFEFAMDRRPGFLDGRPGLWWTVNGELWPDVPMYTVAEGDTVVMRIRNDSGEVHPMHLHGHHAVVLSRNGVPATGSPWWTDSLNVRDGESYEIAFVADNPGIWMDHCHNLPHAADGLVAHLMYAGYTTPYVVGGDEHNEPE